MSRQESHLRPRRLARHRGKVDLQWFPRRNVDSHFDFENGPEGLGDALVGPQTRSFIVKYTHPFDVPR